MKITWLGHSSFLLEIQGVKIVTDPYDNSIDSIGYGSITTPVDCAVVSHDHFDHNHVKGLKGNPETVQGSGQFSVKGITFTGIDTYHDDSKGSQRGDNVVFVIEAEGLRICHVGDLGHALSADQIQAIGRVDVLLLPVGGTYTVDALEATKVMDDLNPKLVIPMHFKTNVLDFPITGVDPFLEGKRNVRHQGSSQIDVTNETLPKEREIVVLEHLL